MTSGSPLPEQQAVQGDISDQQVGPSGTTSDANLANIANIDQTSLLNTPTQAAAGNSQMPGMGPDLQMQQFASEDQFASQQYQARVQAMQLQDQMNQESMQLAAMGSANQYLAAPGYTQGNSSPTSGGLVGAAMSKIGQPYRLGAAIGSGSWDCGSLISWAFAQEGVGGVNRYVPSMLQDPRFKNVQGGLNNAQPGDILFPTGGYGTHLGDHVVMYIGNGQILEAPHPGAAVRIMPVGEYTGYVVKRYGG